MKKTHGFNNTNSRLHVTWSNMKRRCLNPTPKEKLSYNNIQLCCEWYLFVPFMEWALANGYTDELTIDRKDNNKGYFPDNCRFVNYNVQNANRGLTEVNKTGYIGVSICNNKYRATVYWKGKRILSKYFHCPIKASKFRDHFITKNGLPHTLNG